MLVVLIALLAAGASLLTNYLAEHFLTERIAVIGSFAGFQLAHNPGIAFSISLPSSIQTGAIVVALILVCFLAAKSSRSPFQDKAYGLVIGGAIGNIIDRLPDALVTDYFQVGTFPIFNVADSCITIGVVLLLLNELKVHLHRKVD